MCTTGKSSPKVKIIIDLHGKWANLMRRDDQKNGQCHSEIRPACHANIAGNDGSGPGASHLNKGRAWLLGKGLKIWVLVLTAIKSPSPEFMKGLKPWPAPSWLSKPVFIEPNPSLIAGVIMKSHHVIDGVLVIKDKKSLEGYLNFWFRASGANK